MGIDDGGARLPFVPPGATLTASGRQALSLVAQELRLRGITTLLAPAFHCPTMLEPFQLEGMHVELVTVGPDLLLDAAALASALPVAPAAAVLHCETLGNRARSELAAALGTARAAGHAVVVDQTHSFLDAASGAPWCPGPPARSEVRGDFHVASLRKWLPLPDGAWVTGVTPTALPRRPVDQAVTAAGLAALDAAAGAAADTARRFAELEELVDGATAPAAMSPQSLALLAELDGAELVRSRAAAAAALRTRLRTAGVELLNESACFVAVRLPEAERAARRMAESGVPQPLHWARPRHLAAGHPWPEDLVTLPPDANR